MLRKILNAMIDSLLTLAIKAGNFQSTDELIPHLKQPEQIAFIDALINSMTKGEGALKHTCYQTLHTGERVTFVEREQCNKAMKEVAFAKKQYPKALSFVTYYQSRIPRSNLTSQLEFVAKADNFIADCKSKKNIRAAKTMRYWGTTEVGDWNYSNLEEMGALQYKNVLNACKPNSWVTKSRDSVVENIQDEINPVLALSTASPKKCLTMTNKQSWTKRLHEENKNTYAQIRGNINSLNLLIENQRLAEAVLGNINYSEINNIKNNLTKSYSYCTAIIQTGANALAQQEANERRARAEKAKAKRDYQLRLDAQRRAAAAAERQRQIDAQAERRRQQKIQQSNEGVVLD